MCTVGVLDLKHHLFSFADPLLGYTTSTYTTTKAIKGTH